MIVFTIITSEPGSLSATLVGETLDSQKSKGEWGGTISQVDKHKTSGLGLKPLLTAPRPQPTAMVMITAKDFLFIYKHLFIYLPAPV